MRSACHSERLSTVTHGQSWALSGCGYESAQSAFALVRALETSSEIGGQGQDRPVDLPLSLADNEPDQTHSLQRMPLERSAEYAAAPSDPENVRTLALRRGGN